MSTVSAVPQPIPPPPDPTVDLTEGAPPDVAPVADVCVFAPSMLLTVTVEATASDEEGPGEVHVHAGGQGYWLTRLLCGLGHRPILCTSLGGETGAVIRGLLAAEGLAVDLVTVEGATAAYVHDRRCGDRQEVVRTGDPGLSRHERDDLYGATLESAITTGVCVLTGRPTPAAIETGFYRRLGADLGTTGVAVIGDLHGEELDAFLEKGRLQVLKVSDEDLLADGMITERDLDDPTDAGLRTAMSSLADRGVDMVVVSRVHRPTLALVGGRLLAASPPRLSEADHHGAGDSMTAALVRATLESLEPADALRLACAAGAANVTRHGLTTVAPSLVDRLAELVQVTEHPTPSDRPSKEGP